jgi:hypothetical protein
VDSTELADAVKEVVGDRPVFDFTITSDSQTISDFGEGSVKVSVPYTLKEGEDPNQIVVYYIADSGELTLVPDCVYNPQTGTVTFTVNHFSAYALGYKEVHFKDVSGWYSDYVNYLAAREIINGVSQDTFSPNSSITRAQFVTILANLSKDELSIYTESTFSDVKTTDWYFKATQWAYEKGVVTGSNGAFNPNGKIARQDIAVMIDRFAEMTGHSLPKINSAVNFTDSSAISSYASKAVKVIQQEGIISGNSDGSFAPKDSATRAQAAKMIALFLQGMVR